MKKIIGLLITLGSLSWAITMVKSSWLYPFGLGFWGANGHDGIWHIALAKGLARGSMENPVFSGELLKNYHFGFDLLLALLHKITAIPIENLYFQIIPPVFALLIGYLTYILVLDWTKSKISALFSVFFIYFGGSAGWIIGRGESTFWAAQSISSLINPPFALSIIFILLGLIFVLRNKKMAAIICFGLLLQIKAYAAVLIMGGLLFAGIYSLVLKKKIDLLKIFLGSLVLNLVLFMLFKTDNFGSIFIWQPFWFLETMMGYLDRLGWQRFYSAMTTYKMGNIYLKEVIAYSLAFVIFVIGNFWTRLIFLKDLFKKLDNLKILLLCVTGAGIVIPTFFVQTGTPWNTIQFLYYSLFFSGILAGVSLSNLGVSFLKPLVVLFVLLTIPTTIITLKDVFIPNRPPAKLSVEEKDALEFLNKQPDGVVLTYPFDKNKSKEAENNPPRPLYLYESTAYVSAFSGKVVFLEDEVNLNIMGYDYLQRRNNVESWYKETNQVKAIEFLAKNKINYVYLVKPQHAYLSEDILGLNKIFENKEVIIYRYGQNIGSN